MKSEKLKYNSVSIDEIYQHDLNEYDTLGNNEDYLGYPGFILYSLFLSFFNFLSFLPYNKHFHLV